MTGCDLIGAGVEELRDLLSHYRDPLDAAAAYRCGARHVERCRDGARPRLRLARRIEGWWKVLDTAIRRS